MRVAGIAFPSAGERAHVPGFSAIAFESAPSLVFLRFAKCGTTARFTIGIHVRDVVDVSTDVTPHPVLELKMPVEVQPDWRRQSLGGPLLHRVEVQERSREQLAGLIELKREPVSEHRFISAGLETEIVALEAW